MLFKRATTFAIYFMLCNMQLPSSAFPIRDRPFSVVEIKRGTHHPSGCKNKQMKEDLNFEKVKVTNFAQKEAQKAKAASEAQQAAGQQAAHQIKTQLAEKAYNAAEAAEAALTGKEDIIEKLEEELNEAEKVVQEECASLHEIQQQDQDAIQTAKLANEEVQALAKAFNLAKDNSIQAEAAAEGADQQLEEKSQLVDMAKQHLEDIQQDLSDARADLENTKQAAQKAIEAANAAKENADRNRRKLQNSFIRK